MRSVRDFSITAKLTLLVLLASGVALLLATVCFVLNDISMLRSSMVRQISILAEILSADSEAALNFQDNDRAVEILESLRRQPAVEFACIYNAQGEPFATYRETDAVAAPPPAMPHPGAEFVSGGYLDVVRSIDHDGRSLGTIYLHANANELRDQILRYGVIVVAMLTISMGTSVLLAGRFQRLISAPILRLADAVKQVSKEGNYAIRVAKQSNDELGTLYDQFNTMLAQIQQSEATIQRAHDELEIKIQKRTSELSQANTELSRENSVRLQAEKELEATHQKLVDAARRAGMAEIATGVLHNVGNVLNSINVSASLVSDKMKNSKISDLPRALNLIEQNSNHLGAFFSSDPKGKQLSKFLALLSEHLIEERAGMVSELDQLTMRIEHVKAIVATQQSYAGVSGLLEEVDLASTLNDAMQLNLASFERDCITVVNEFQDLPNVRIDKQRVLQILVNLIKNAREAFYDLPHKLDRQITIRALVSDQETLQIHVIDNGIGIAAENITKIFSHGFTTKKTGHGFGLHGCANAAVELGGALTVHSDGPERGATFVLEIPYRPVTRPIKAIQAASEYQAAAD
jgi:two-component system, NtrC family, sensor kinase